MKVKPPTREQIANSIRRAEMAVFDPAPAASAGHERIEQFNASLATETYFSQPLTDFSVGYRDADLDAELAFFAPEVPVSDRFEYAQIDNAEEFLSDGDDDERPMRGDFKDVEYTESKVQDRTYNRGLQITLDLDQLRGRSGWEEFYVQKLLRRLKRNSLRRAIAALSNAAVNTAKTWDTTAGKDPDLDVIQELITSANVAGIKPNRVGYGDTASSKRQLSHRAQSSAGGFASATLTPDQLAGYLGVDGVLFSQSRYTTGATTKAEALGNLVLMFTAFDGMDTEDASNIKRFVSNGSPEEGGGRYQVYSARVSAKKHIIAVGHYERIKITSTLGIRKFTVS